jgi:limonene-1,2-epoxide hydrolase
MSNVETVRSFYAAFNRRDWVALEALMSPSVEWFNAARAEHVRGAAAVVALFRSSADAFPDARVDVRRIHDAGEFVITECSLTRKKLPGAAKAAAPLAHTAGTAQPGAQAIYCEVGQFVDGKCVRGSTYADTFRLIEQGLAA